MYERLKSAMDVATWGAELVPCRGECSSQSFGQTGHQYLCLQMFTVLRIGEGDTFFEITPWYQPYRNASDASDRSWITTRVTVKAGAFNGNYEAYFQTTDFAELRANFEQCERNPKHDFRFEPIESQLELTVNGDGLGHFTFACAAMDKPSFGALLRFEFVVDQTFIKSWIIALDEILSQFPFAD